MLVLTKPSKEAGMEQVEKANLILAEAEEKMDVSLARIEEELAKIRAGRASVALVDHIIIEAYDDKMPLRQLANITTPDANTIKITPYDKNIIKNIEKGIASSELGLNPINDGNVIRINIPPLTEERRREVLKVASKVAEDGRVALRNIRREAKDALRKLESGKEIGKDEYHFLLDELEKLLQKRMEKVDELYKKKDEEILLG